MPTTRTASRTIRSASVFPDPEFPLRVMRVASHRATDLHSHAFNELVLILGGHGRHRTDRGDYRIEAGDVFVLRGDMAHGYADTEGLDLVNILFSPRRLKLPLADVGSIPGYHALFRLEPRLRQREGVRPRLRLAPEELADAARLAAAMEEELAQRRPGYRLMACSHLLRLIGYLSRCYSDIRAPESRRLLELSKVLSFMDQHYPEAITVGQLARLAAMSETSLLRRFRQAMGRSPIDYLIRLRVSRACELLQRDDLRITDVAFRCGFNDSNYFSRQFRRVMRLSPRAFRAGERQAHAEPGR
jgi:AraC-like DNA-binding protein/quercetin dioxygenase-like cupin family protein